MFCIQCGKELPAYANFCLFCGARLKLVAEAAGVARPVDTEATLVLKPHFVLSTILLPTIFIWGFFTVWCGGFCGGFSMLGLKFIENLLGFKLPEGSTFIFWGAAAFFGVPIIAITRYRLKCKNTEYRIYSDRIETVYEGRTRRVETVPFAQVTGLEFKRCRALPQLKLGTITIHTPATIKLNNQLKGAMGLETIENAEELYERLKVLTTDAPPPPPPRINTGD